MKQALLKSWWVIGFILCCAIFYERGLKKIADQYQQLNRQQHALQLEKQKALDLQKNIQIELESYNDLAWQELILMRYLGLVPEGYQKVYFDKGDPLLEK